MQFTANSTSLDIILDHVNMGSGFKGPRFGMEMWVLSSDDVTDPSVTKIMKGGASLNVHRSLDDEYTPGIFHVSSTLVHSLP